MSETKTPWRPGPYVAQHSINLDGYRILAPTGTWVGEVASKEEAQLLAAAPSLYEALEKALRQMRIWVSINGDMVGALQEVIDECDAALALARGEDK